MDRKTTFALFLFIKWKGVADFPFQKNRNPIGKELHI